MVLHVIRALFFVIAFAVIFTALLEQEFYFDEDVTAMEKVAPFIVGLAIIIIVPMLKNISFIF